MLYNYVAYTNDKKIVEGTIESASIEMAQVYLYKTGYKRILNLETINTGLSWRRYFKKSDRVSTEVLLDFTMELEILTESGMTLLMALDQLQKQSIDKNMKEIINKLVMELQSGTSFHQTLRKYPQVFPETYCCIMEANERSGTLDAGLRQISRQIKAQIAMRTHLQGALTQPAIITGLAIIVAIIMAIVVLPQLTSIFNQFGAELPWNAKLLINISNFIVEQKLLLIACILALALIIIAVLKNRATKPLLDKWIFSLPVVGQIVSWNNTAYFSRILSNLLSAGILLPDGIKLITGGISNTYYRNSLDEARQKLLQGQSFSSSMSQNKLFPPLLVELIGVGEVSGNLDSALGTVASYFESKVEKKVNKLISLLEPALTIVIALVVGFLAITMISSIYGLVGSVKT